MLHLIYGGPGSGKTHTVIDAISRLVEQKKPSFLLVPEQYTLVSERDMAGRLPPAAPLFFEVTNFSRLSDTAFRKVGGLSFRYAKSGTKNLFMWRTLRELLPLLSEKGTVEPGRVKKAIAAARELRHAGITPEALQGAAAQLPESDHLSLRLRDLSLTMTIYHRLLSERYNDADDDLDRLLEILKVSRLFEGSAFFVDSFTSFTEVEYGILLALAQYTDVTVTLPLPEDHAEKLCYTEPWEARRRLLRLAERRAVPFDERTLSGNHRTASPMLSYLTQRMWNALGAPPFSSEEKEDEPLILAHAADPYRAAEFVAADIRRRVMNGARYRDFAIVAHDAKSYAGILDDALASSEIPFYMSTKVDITSFEVIKYIFAAYSVIGGGYRTKDVIAFLKCGLSAVETRDADRFEIYVTKWKIRGKRRFCGGDFTMNPDGYSATLRPGAEAFLAAVNRARRAAILPLSLLEERLADAKSVRDHCRALVSFLTEARIPEALMQRAAEEKARGDTRRSGETARLWDVICDALDTLVDALPDVEIDSRVFPELLRLVFDETSIGEIPTSADAVTVGSASDLRTSSVRHVYLFGVNEGEFPAPVTDTGVFSDTDRRRLEALGLPLSPDLSLRASRELYSFLRAFSSASERVTLVLAKASTEKKEKKPSEAYRRIEALAKEHAVFVDADTLPPLSLLYTRSAAIDALPSVIGHAGEEALLLSLAEDPAAERRISAAKTPITEESCRVSGEIMREWHRSRLSLSQAKMDSYVSCPFSYFCKYVLSLGESDPVDFSFLEMGNCMHAILESIHRYTEESSTPLRELRDDELSAIVDRAISRYKDEIGVDRNGAPPRVLHALKGLRRQGLLFAEELRDEFRQSEFVPIFAEMDLTGKSGIAPDPVRYTLKDGTVLSLTGKVDRVDIWKKDRDIYFRIVDYKTGQKEFSLADIKRGKSTQLLFYLFTILKSRRPAFLDYIGLTDGKTRPAGVLYMETSTGDLSLPHALPPDEMRAAAKRAVSRNGLLNNDLDVLSAMEKELSGHYAPVTQKKDGSLSPGKSTLLCAEGDFATLSDELDQTIRKIGNDMMGGVMDMTPEPPSEEGSPCTYCKMKAICRKV